MSQRKKEKINSFITSFLIVSLFLSPLSPLVSYRKAEAVFNKQINYQGKLTTTANIAVANGTYNMEFKLYDSGSTLLWTETRTGANKVQVTSGLFSVMLGEVNSLASVDFNQTLYLGVNIGGTGTPGWDGEMTPRKKLGAVPAAVVSETVTNAAQTAITSLGSLTGLTVDTNTLFVDSVNHRVGVGTITPAQKLDVAGNVNISTGSAYMYNGVNMIIANPALNNYFFGDSGNQTTTGWGNMAFGYHAFGANTTGGVNTAIGHQALGSNTTGQSNTALGFQSLYANTSGNYNVAVGVNTLGANTTGQNNAAIGYQVMAYNTTGTYNAALGHQTLFNNTTGWNNTAVGTYGLQDNTTGSYNTAIGNNTGRGIVTGTGNTILGAGVTGLAAALTNNIILANGTGAIKAQNDGTNWNFTGNLGIGVPSPTAYLNIKAGTATAGTAPIKLTAGTNLTAPEAGAIEYDGTNLYFTPSATRETIATKTYADTKLALSVLNDTTEITGFLDANNSNINVSYDWTSRTVTLTGGLDYYWRGVKHTMTSPWTSNPHPNTFGSWYLSTTDGVNFTWSNSPWSFSDVQVALVDYQSSAASSFAVRETHGTMDSKAHEELHSQVGTYRVSGGQLTSGTYTENTATDAGNTMGFDSSIIKDEDNNTAIPTWSDGTYTTMYVGPSSTNVFNTTASLPFISGGAGTYLQVNNPISGTMTSGVDARWYNVYEVMIPTGSDTNSQKYRTVMLQPQFTYTSLASAQGEDVKNLNFGNLPSLSPEFVVYARITYVTANGDANAGKARIATGGVTYVIGNKAGQVSVAGFTTNNHSILSNLTWTTSGHLGSGGSTPTVAAFDALGAAVELGQNGTGKVVLDTAPVLRGFLVDDATLTHDRIGMSAAAIGTARFDGTITNADLTATRTWTLPDNTGTLALTSDLTSSYVPYTGGTSNVDLGIHNLTVDTNSLFVDSVNHRVGVGTITPAQKLDVAGNVNISTGSAYMINGTNVVTANPTLSNYFFGNAGNLTMTGYTNVGNGLEALLVNNSGYNNTAVGARSLDANDSGYHNTAVGSYSLHRNVSGIHNAALGSNALGSTTGSYNTGIGSGNLYNNSTGSYNTAIGTATGLGITTGSGNTILGASVSGLAAGLTNNIILANGTGAIKAQNDGTNWNLTGNVGIGVASPTAALHLKAGSDVANGAPLKLTSGTLTTGANITAGSIEFNNDAYYGTTTTGPTRKQFAFTSDITTSLGSYLPLAGGTMTGGITNSTSINPLTTLAESWIGPSSTTGVYFKGGNVGVGTTTPNEKLDVNGAIQIRGNSVGYSNVSNAGMLDAYGGGTYGGLRLIAFGDALNYGDIRFYNAPANNVGHVDSMIIKGNGKVGIGNISPSELLTLGTAGTTAGNISLAGATSGKAILQVQAAAGTPTLTLPTTTGTLALTGDSGSGYLLATGAVTGATSQAQVFTNGVSVATGSSYKTNGASSLTDQPALNNIFLGQAGNATMTGTNNIFGGYQSGVSNTTGSGNVFLGNYAGIFNTTGTDNNFLGTSSGWKNTSGYNNNFFGYTAGVNNTTGFDNNFFGAYTGVSNTTGSVNNFIGREAGHDNTSGTDNNFLGAYSGRLNTTGNLNNFFGRMAGYANTTGTQNNFEGYQSGYHNTTGNNNIASGAYSFAANTAGFGNIAIGYESVASNTTGYYNIGMGYDALASNTTGSYNTAIGYGALYSTTTSDYNTAIGWYALRSNTSGIANTAVGQGTGHSVTTGSANTFYGYNSGGATTTGAGNTFIGVNAGQSNVTGGNSVYLGDYAGSINTYGNNIAIGDYAMGFGSGARDVVIGNVNAGYSLVGDDNLIFGNSSGSGTGNRNIVIGNSVNIGNGSDNIFVGIDHGTWVSTGINNILIGARTGRNISTGSENTFQGYWSGAGGSGYNTGNNNSFYGAYSGASIAIGSFNSLFGDRSGYDLSDGDYNTIYGYNTGRGITTGSGNTILGAQVSGLAAALTNNIILANGTGAIKAQNDGTNWNLTGNVGIGVVSPGYKLEVGTSAVSGIVARFVNSTGTCDINPTTSSLACSSDINLKKNITNLGDGKEFSLQTVPDLTDKSTLEKMNYLTSVRYNWKSEGDTDPKHTGFIAQEMEQIFPDLVSTDPVTGLKSISYANLTPYLVQSIQEMNLKFEDINGVNNMDKPNIFRMTLTAWFGNAANKITRIFTGEICLTDPDGTTECINKTELKSLKGLINSSGTASVGGSLGGGAGTPPPSTPLTCTLPEVLTNGVCVVPVVPTTGGEVTPPTTDGSIPPSTITTPDTIVTPPDNTVTTPDTNTPPSTTL